jgi:hypothetical protein
MTLGVSDRDAIAWFSEHSAADGGTARRGWSWRRACFFTASHHLRRHVGGAAHRAADLGVGLAFGDEQGDLQFLRGELLCVAAGRADGLAAGAEFGAGAVAPGAGVESVEDVGRGAELDAGVAAALCAAQPLAVAQPGPRMVEGDFGALVLGDPS